MSHSICMCVIHRIPGANDPSLNAQDVSLPFSNVHAWKCLLMHVKIILKNKEISYGCNYFWESILTSSLFYLLLLMSSYCLCCTYVFIYIFIHFHIDLFSTNFQFYEWILLSESIVKLQRKNFAMSQLFMHSFLLQRSTKNH